MPFIEHDPYLYQRHALTSYYGQASSYNDVVARQWRALKDKIVNEPAIVSCDFASLEARTMAMVSNKERLLNCTTRTPQFPEARRNHDSHSRRRYSARDTLTEVQVTTMLAARMGGIHQVHRRDGRRITYHLGTPDGMDVTIQIHALNRRRLLEGVTYKTWDEVD